MTNIGREKLERYEKIQPESITMVEPYTADYAGDLENGFFLAWVSWQKDWQDALRKQVLGTLQGNEPKKVFVLDDANFEGGTFRIVLRLMGDIFPECETRMLAGDMFGWRNEIAESWLSEHGINPETQKDHYFSLRLIEFVPGTEDDGKTDFFEWRVVTPGNKVFKVLGKHLPVTTWMELPAWAEREIKQRVAAFAQNGKIDGELEERLITRPELDRIEHILQHVWLYGSIR